ncbi:MAG: hypothetical protein R2867_01930 [Caldilineaceae bacterium]
MPLVDWLTALRQGSGPQTEFAASSASDLSFDPSGTVDAISTTLTGRVRYADTAVPEIVVRLVGDLQTLGALRCHA